MTWFPSEISSGYVNLFSKFESFIFPFSIRYYYLLSSVSSVYTLSVYKINLDNAHCAKDLHSLLVLLMTKEEEHEIGELVKETDR